MPLCVVILWYMEGLNVQPQPVERSISSVETAEQVKARHEKWLIKAKDRALEIGGGTLLALGGITQLIAFLDSASNAMDGNFERSLTAIGVLALARIANKAILLGMSKGLSSESNMRKALEERVDEKEIRRMKSAYNSDPERVKKV